MYYTEKNTYLRGCVCARYAVIDCFATVLASLHARYQMNAVTQTRAQVKYDSGKISFVVLKRLNALKVARRIMILDLHARKLYNVDDEVLFTDLFMFPPRKTQGFSSPLNPCFALSLTQFILAICQLRVHAEASYY